MPACRLPPHLLAPLATDSKPVVSSATPVAVGVAQIDAAVSAARAAWRSRHSVTVGPRTAVSNQT